MPNSSKTRESNNDNKDKQKNNSNDNKMTNASTHDDQVTDSGPSPKYPHSRFRRPSAPLEEQDDEKNEGSDHSKRLLASRPGLIAEIDRNAGALLAKSSPSGFGRGVDEDEDTPSTSHTFTSTSGPCKNSPQTRRRPSLQYEYGHASRSSDVLDQDGGGMFSTPDNEISNGQSDNDFGSSPADAGNRGRPETQSSPPNAYPGIRKLSSSSCNNGDPVLFHQRLFNLGLLHSSPAPACFVKADKGKGKGVEQAEALPSLEESSEYDALHTNAPTSSPSTHELGHYQDQEESVTLWNEGACPISSDSISSGIVFSSAGDGRNGNSQPRLRDSSLTTQHMPSSPPHRYQPSQASGSSSAHYHESYLPEVSRARPSPAHVADIFAQRSHANASGHPPVRPFEPAQWIPDMYQEFAGHELSGPANPGTGFPFGGHVRSGYYGLGQFGSGPALPLLIIPSQFNPMARGFYPQQQQQQQQQYQQPPYPESQYPQPQQHYQYLQHQPRYKGGGGGSRPSHSDPSIGNPHIAPHLNTCLWLEGFPATLTYAELTASIRHCGRIFCAYINEPQNGHPTCAAKVAFFSRAGAERLLAQFYRGEFQIRGAPLRRVLWNRNAYTGSCHPTATRILLIRGPAKWVNLITLSSYFRRLFWCHLVRVDDVSMSDAAVMAGDEGWLESGLGVENLAEDYREMAAMRWEFGSFHAQAQAAKQACERETAFMGLVKVNYLADPCDYTG